MYYAASPRADILFQGDVLDDVPVVMLQSDVRIYRPAESPPAVRPEADTPEPFAKGPEQVVVQAHKTKVMVLSQTCDIQQREFVAIAPIMPMSQVSNKERRRAITDGRVNYRFWLPATDRLEESFVELTILNSVPRARLHSGQRILSLSDAGRHHLADRIYHLYCRPVFTALPPEGGAPASDAPPSKV